MKRKEIIQLAVAMVILVAAGALIYSQIAPKSKAGASAGQTVQVITPINPGFNSSALSTLTDGSKTHDFYTAPNLASGLGNSDPFVAPSK